MIWNKKNFYNNLFSNNNIEREREQVLEEWRNIMFNNYNYGF